jgi:hypothetical protein
MAFLTERKLANTLDIPVNLPATEIKMGDWLVIASIRLTAPSKLTYRMLHLNFIGSSLDLSKIAAVNRLNANGGLCYVGLYANYVSGDPATATALDMVPATEFGVITRSANPIVLSTPATYSWIAVNNIQWNAGNASLSVQDSADFKLSATGQCRIELDLTQ